MKLPLKNIFLLSCVLFTAANFAQNRNAKWFFGYQAGLDFLSNPPGILTGSMIAPEGCASVANSVGALLFYTDGNTIYNQNHLPMANGTGLFGDISSTQAALIAKQPGNSNIYYVFCNSALSTATPAINGVFYSVVDMNLAAGMGSVTAKNILFSLPPVTEKLASAKHCNGTDIWIVTHDFNSTVFRAYQLSNLGLNTVAVTSSVGLVHISQVGYLKISSNGRKLASVQSISSLLCYLELCDFDNSTGLVSNPQTFALNTSAYGCEFSPDASKLYSVTRIGLTTRYLTQWDLCAGSPSAIITSETPIGIVAGIGGIQIAPNGKVYIVTAANSNSLGVINNPNVAGLGCNFVNQAQSLGGNAHIVGLPNHMHDFQKAPIAPINYTASNNYGCQAVLFNSPATPGATFGSCVANSYTLLNLSWDFGDPLSGGANSSVLSNPTHTYTGPGTYTVKLILNFGCGGGVDTLKQVLNIYQPCINVNSFSITCASLGSATVNISGGYGPYTYTWLPSNQTASVAAGLNPGTHTILITDAGNNITSTVTSLFSSLIPLTGSISASQSVSCNGAGTATGAVTNLAGGSGNQTYLWSNGASTSSVAAPNNLSAGSWSVTVTDALTACQVYSVFTITQPSGLTLNIAPPSASACAGTSITLTGTNSGGTPGYTYTWTAGPSTNTRTVSQSTAGTLVYTLNSRDANLCLTTKTISFNFVPNPTLSVSDVSICPLQMGTLSASGASSYTWNASSSVGSSFTASPVGSTQYAVAGTALGCTAATTASIIVKPVPSPTISNNSPICNGQTLLLSASGGAAYLWSGPLSFVSSAQNPTISSAAPNRSGVYNLTVTAANSCTAPASTNVLVNATPTISMSGGQVCLNSSLFLSANSFTGASYLWSGPNSFTSNLQNPTISSVTFSAAGNYSLMVNSVSSCTNVSSVGVTVNPLPTITIVPNSTVICTGKSSTLTASGATSYLWNTGSSSTLLVVSPTLTTSYTVVGTSALGCTNTAVRNISVNILPSVSVTVNPTVYCSGKNSTLTASGASTYTWSTNATSNAIVASPLFTTFYNVKGTSAITGCSNTAFATVSVNPLPSLTVTATKTIICTGTSASITASGANTYTWVPGNLSGANITPTPSVNTTYTVRGTISASGCTNTAVRTMSVNKTPSVSMFAGTPSICIGWSAVITPSGASTYTLVPGNLSGNSFTVSPSSTTQFSLSGTNSVNCVNLISSNVNIIVHNLKAIQGVVTSTTGQTNGNVVLYGYKPVLGKWDSLNTSLVILNNYNFPSVPSGSYVVKSFPFPTDLVETYGLSASSWKSASVINHNCLVNSTQNINIITFNNTIKSKATLSGKITQGAGYAQPGSPGSGIPTITVKAGIHPGPVIYQTTKTNALGQYTLANMAPNVSGQNYYILVDIPALDTNKTYHRIIITGFENFTNLDFVVDSQRIHPMNLKVGVKELSMLNTKIKVYPNPANDQISIELELNETEEVSLELFDLIGRKIKTLLSESTQEKGKLTVLAKVEELKEGVYLLKLKIGEEEGVIKLNILR